MQWVSSESTLIINDCYEKIYEKIHTEDNDVSSSFSSTKKYMKGSSRKTLKATIPYNAGRQDMHMHYGKANILYDTLNQVIAERTLGMQNRNKAKTVECNAILSIIFFQGTGRFPGNEHNELSDNIT